MPLELFSNCRPSYKFTKSLTEAEVKWLATNPSLLFVTPSGIVEDDTWDLLNAELFCRRPDIELMVSGNYHRTTDLTFLSRTPDLRHLRTHDIWHSVGFENITALKNLISLGVEIRDLTDFNFLNDLNPESLALLRLESTHSKKPSLAPIRRFSNLKNLQLTEQKKGIEAIADLSNLEDLTMRSISVPSLEFLVGLSKLWSVDIKLGGTNALDHLRHCSSVKYLELWSIRGLVDISPISDMIGLQYLFLQSLNRVVELPDLSRLSSLKRIHLEQLRAVTDLTPLLTAPALEEIIHHSAMGLSPEDYQPMLSHPTLKYLLVGFGSNRKNERLNEMASLAGLNKGEPLGPFVFS